YGHFRGGDCDKGARVGWHMKAAPVALFAYERPEHTRRTVEALKKNELARDTELIVFCDLAKGAKTAKRVREVGEYVRNITGFKSVRTVFRERNLGLAGSIIDGVTRVCGEHGRVIVLEDDLVTSRFFLKFMNDSLDAYETDDSVGSVHGYWYPVAESVPATFFLKIASS